MTVTVRGINEIQANLTQAGTQLENLQSAHAMAAQIIIAAAHPPRLTGRLQASIRQLPGEGMIVGSLLPYARKIEARTSYLTRAAETTRTQWLGVYETEVARVCNAV
jgi:hypothetical protein